MGNEQAVEVVRLKELADYGDLEFSDGYRTRKDQLATSGVPILRVAEVLDGRVAPEENDFVSVEFRRKMGTKTSQTGDVLVTTKGTVGRVAQVPGWLTEHVYSPQLCFLRVLNHDRIDSRWLYFFARSALFQEQVRRFSGQTDMAPYLSLTDLREFEVPLPQIAEQRRIAGVLGALDDLIETNQRLADSCVGLRRALVRRALAECDETVPLSSVARFVNGKNFTKGASGRGLPVIRTPEIRRGPDASTVRSDVAAEQDFRAAAGDILFVWSGSLMVERWLYEEGLVNQHIFKVIPEPGCPSWLVFALIEHQMPWFLGLAADKATTMGHIQREHLDALVPWPGDAAIRELAQTVEPLWDQELALRIEMQQLAHTRDELLPLLLSGRVSVREVAA